MIQLHIQKREELNTLISFRSGEKKLGESLDLCDSLDQIKESSAKFVVFGIAEDIGVQANYGNKGAKEAWNAFLKAFVNVQDNRFNNGSSIIVLGAITITPNFAISKNTPKGELGALINRIDKKVALVVETIVASGKIPIIIGGGHNNALGNLQGTYQALQRSVNAINIDAHTDLRTQDYRHSGNGFSYAMQQENTPYLNKYAIFGLHKNYTPQYIFEAMDAQANSIQYRMFEDLLGTKNRVSDYQSLLDFVSGDAFGLELDCDAIEDFPSSAQTPSGFAFNEVRQFVMHTAACKNCTYFHICEAAPSKKNQSQVGKALSYLVTDFIRSWNDHHTLS